MTRQNHVQVTLTLLKHGLIRVMPGLMKEPVRLENIYNGGEAAER